MPELQHGPAFRCAQTESRRSRCVGTDRLARSLKQLLSIAEECRSLGVDLVSLKQNVDTTLPAGRLTFQVLGAVAEFEREMLSTTPQRGRPGVDPLILRQRRLGSGVSIGQPIPRGWALGMRFGSDRGF